MQNTQMLGVGAILPNKRGYSDSGANPRSTRALSTVTNFQIFQAHFKAKCFKLGPAPPVADSASGSPSTACLAKYSTLTLRQEWPLPPTEAAEAMIRQLGPDMALAGRWLLLDPAREHTKYFAVYDLLKFLAKLQVSFRTS